MKKILIMISICLNSLIYSSSILIPLDEQLYEAVISNNIDKVRCLIDAGANIHIRSDYGNTLLHRAASFGYLDIVTLLLKAGIYINSKNPFNVTPLHFAACNEHPEIITLLLEAGADVDSNDRFNDTPFDSAIFSNKFNSAKAIVQGGFLYGGYSLQNIQEKIAQYPQLQLDLSQLYEYVSEQYPALLQRQQAAINQFCGYLYKHRLIITDVDTGKSYKIVNCNEVQKDAKYTDYHRQLSPYDPLKTYQSRKKLRLEQDYPGFLPEEQFPSLQSLCAHYIAKK